MSNVDKYREALHDTVVNWFDADPVTHHLEPALSELESILQRALAGAVRRSLPRVGGRQASAVQLLQHGARHGARVP